MTPAARRKVATRIELEAVTTGFAALAAAPRPSLDQITAALRPELAVAHRLRQVTS